MYLLLFCSERSEDHGNDGSETLAQNGDKEESRSSDASESDKQSSIHLVDQLGHPPLFLSDAKGTAC